MTNTFFVEYQDQSRSQEHVCITAPEFKDFIAKPNTINDIIILPITAEMVVEVDVTDNGEKLFPTLKMNAKNLNIDVGQCSMVYNYQNLGMPKIQDTKKKSSDDDEDFDEDDDLFEVVENIFTKE